MSALAGVLAAFVADNHGDTYGADKDADGQFRSIFEEQKRTEEAAEPSLKQIPRFFFKKAETPNARPFRIRYAKAPGGGSWTPFGEVEQRLLPPLFGGGRAKGQEGAGARASGISGGDGVGHGGVWLGWETTEKRRQRE
jgi:hypothetical protein